MEPTENTSVADHSHDAPLITIEITFDPNHNSINYKFDNTNYFQALGFLAWVQQLMFADFQAAQQKFAMAEVTSAD